MYLGFVLYVPKCTYEAAILLTYNHAFLLDIPMIRADESTEHIYLVIGMSMLKYE